MSDIIEKYKSYQGNQKLIDEIALVISTSYKLAGEHINKDIEICDDLYVSRSESGLMLALFMVGYHKINDTNCCYLGLSACREEFKNKGFVKALYLEFIQDCITKENETGKRILCYWTTATPIVYHWFTTHFSNVQPNKAGDCTPEGKAQLLDIANAKYNNADFSDNFPFLLRNAAHEINYSDSERERIAKAIKDLNLNVFEKYHLDESKGDRFLMIGYASPHN